MPRVLSIDWDYFAEEDPRLDFGHSEQWMGLYLSKEFWEGRTKWYKHGENGKLEEDENGKPVVYHRPLEEMLPFRGDEHDVLQMECLLGWRMFGLYTKGRNYKFAVAESHSRILGALEGVNDLEIVNIDAHHDLFYKDKPSEITTKDCGNWGYHLINEGRVKSWKQIYPAWRQKFPETEMSANGTVPFRWATKRLGDRFSVVYGKKPSGEVRWKKVDYVFVCRSGCWTPPVYDERFGKFCELLGLRPKWSVR